MKSRECLRCGRTVLVVRRTDVPGRELVEVEVDPSAEVFKLVRDDTVIAMTYGYAVAHELTCNPKGGSDAQADADRSGTKPTSRRQARAARRKMRQVPR